MKFKEKLFLIIILLLTFPASAQDGKGISLSAESLKDGHSIRLDKPVWKYRAGDDPSWADPEFDDAGWQSLDPSRSNAGGSWQDWDGIGWFRVRLNIDESLSGQPVSFMIRHYGASEIYLDGELLKRFGEIGENSDSEYNPQYVPVPFVFSSAGSHLLAVRYSFQASRDSAGMTGAWLARGGFAPQIYAFLQLSYEAQNSYTSQQLAANDYKLYSGVLLAFAFLHFLLFLFYRGERANLYYSLFAFCLATGSACAHLFSSSRQPALIAALTFTLFVVFYSSSFLALLSFLYSAFAEKFSKFFWFLLVYLAFLIIILAIYSRRDFTLYVVVGFILLAVADALRIVFSALRRGKDGAWIIMAGLGVFSLGVLMLLTYELELAVWEGGFTQFQNIALYLAIPVSVSIYLARNFARVNRNLEAKLIEVEAFSEREIAHEKEKARLLLIEAENERRAKELEEAKQLQLSMLPKKLPNMPNLEIAAYMKPATEVGGDYYDFHVGEDGTLTVAVGDATGHGLGAGSIVTATKGLFNNLADAPNIPKTFRQISSSLKAMNLRGLFMAMAMLKIKDGKMTLGIAGMPAILIYRAETRTVEEVLIKALPLGSVAGFPYKERNFDLSSGDCVLVMSDGFPEMFNNENEMLGFEKAAAVLPEVIDKSAAEIIESFVSIGEDWACGRPQDDDVTFVVMKVKTGEK